jgi:hypothetical protein
MATTLSAASITLSVHGAQGNIYPQIIPARLEKKWLKDDNTCTRLFIVLIALVTMTPVSPNAHHAHPPPMFRWISNYFPPLVLLTGGLF